MGQGPGYRQAFLRLGGPQDRGPCGGISIFELYDIIHQLKIN